MSKCKYVLIAKYYEGEKPKYQLVLNGESLMGTPKPAREVYHIVRGILNYLYYEGREIK